jgi:hypothetical protein
MKLIEDGEAEYERCKGYDDSSAYRQSHHETAEEAVS